MAEDLRDTLNKFRAFIDGIPAFSDEVAVTLSLNATQLVNSRIVDTGTDANGQPLVHKRSGKDYSDTQLPVSTFVDSGMITPGKAKSLPVFVSYVDVKKSIGRYTGKRNLTLTGAMWKNTGLTSKQVTPGGFVATVAGKTAETQMKLDNNSIQSDTNVLTLSKEEEEILAGDLDVELQQYIDTIGL